MQEEPEEVTELITQWEERGIKKGIEQGITQGIIEGITQGKARGKQETLLRLMRHKFNELPENITFMVTSIDDLEKLDALSDLVLDAKTLKDMGLDSQL